MVWPNVISTWVDFIGLMFLISLSAMICLIDLTRQIIPDRCNAVLALGGAIWMGLSQGGLFWRCLEALVAALLIAGLSALYQQQRQRRGLGGGDIKILVAATLWVGLAGLPWLVLAASMSGLAEVTIRMASRQVVDSSTKIAFGPHLCLGLLLSWLGRDYTAIL